MEIHTIKNKIDDVSCPVSSYLNAEVLAHFKDDSVGSALLVQACASRNAPAIIALLQLGVNYKHLVYEGVEFIKLINNWSDPKERDSLQAELKASQSRAFIKILC